MTLTITMINRYGVWQSSDLRIRDLRMNTVRDDYSNKHVVFQCRDGTALLAYSGAGRVQAVHISDWLRRFTRGANRTIDDTLFQIRHRATDDLGDTLLKLQVPHMFTIGAFIGGTPWLVQIRNFRRSANEIERQFETSAMRLGPGGKGAVVAPWPRIISTADEALLAKAVMRRPRNVEQYSDLLASINLRTARLASTQGTVSPHCVTSYLPPVGANVHTRMHNAPIDAPMVSSPLLLFGIDLTDMMRDTGREPPSPEEYDRIGRNSVRPDNPLKRK